MSTFIPPHTSSRRAALLEQLIVALTSAPRNGLPIKTRAPDDPTIALLDAWATVGDVLGFYLDRIAEEGYLSTATQPGSILALASLVGYQPAPGLAAQVYLAYTLGPDLTDKAVQFSPGLLFQSVPAPGQQAQTFESAQAIIARPSWNLLSPKSTQPVQPTDTSLVINSTSANLSPNDMILLEVDGGQCPVAVASSTVDYTAKITNVTLQAPAVTMQAAAVPLSSSSATSPTSQAPLTTESAMNRLLASHLGKPTTPVLASANQLTQTATSVFSADSGTSDAVPRLISTLQPAVASTLYAALGSTTVGSPPVTAASAMQVTAAPFGAATPPQTIFSASGQPAGTRDWPIGDTFTLQLSVTAEDFARLHDAGLPRGKGIPGWLHRLAGADLDESVVPVIDLQCSVAAFASQSTIEVSSSTANASPALQGFGEVSLAPGAPGTVVLSYAGGPAAGAPSPTPPTTPALQVTVGSTADAIKADFSSGISLNALTPLGSLTWDPNVRTPFNGQVGQGQVAISWATTPGGGAALTVSIAMPLPLTNQTVLLLDGNYPGITSNSYVVIDSALSSGSPSSSSSSSGAPSSSSSSSGASSSSSYGAPSSSSSSSGASSSSSSSSGASSSSSSGASSVSYPVITTITSVDTVAATGFGITGKVTQLTLEAPWIGSNDVLQSALRPLTVYAQPSALPLQPAPVTDDVSQSSIDLDGLVAGMEPGRLIAITGIRTDVPGATVQSGEIAMVASVSTIADAGGTPYSTLNLANALAYTYQRPSVQIYGNVVASHQGATINQVLGSGQPAQAPQSFTLTSGPLLADPSPTGSGYQSSLTVTVDGVGYTQVDRVDSTTPAQSFVAGTNASGQTTIVFPSPVPAGTANIGASYRAGDGIQGNLSAGQITQLLSRPASLSAVINPLPATGGSGGDDQEAVRAAAPVSLSGLGRVVTLSDYADLASSFAGVGKASATLTAGTGVVVTIAGTDPAALDDGDVAAVKAAIAAVADPALPVQVLPADVYLIALTADVAHDPTVSWDDTVAAVQAALLANFGYAQRTLGQNVAVSDLIAAAHAAPGVLSFKVTGLALVPGSATATQLSVNLPTLLTPKTVPTVATLAAVPTEWQLKVVTPTPAAVAYLSDTAPGTLILSEQTT